MADQVKFVDVKINVNGQVHNVKVEQGVCLKRGYYFNEYSQGNSVWTADSNGLKSIKTSRNGEYGGFTYSIIRNNEIKMSEAEWALFKNVADNDNNAGTLTKDDITKAQNLYKNNKFTEDISKGLPKGYQAYKGNQRLGDNEVSAFADNQSVAQEIANENYEYHEAHLTFSKTEDTEVKHLEKLIAQSSDGKVTIDEVGDGGGTYVSIKESDGVTRTYHYGGYGSGMRDKELTQEEYTDSNGTVITNSIEGNFTEKVSVINGKTITEHYDNDDPNYSRITVEYDEGEKHIKEVRNTHKQLKYKEVTYKKGGKEYTEEYNSKNKLEHRNYHTEGKYDNVDEYYKDGKLTKISYPDSKKYYENGKVIRTEKSISEKGYFAGVEVTEKGIVSRYDKSDRLTKVGDFDVKKYSQTELSAKAKIYQEAYKGEKADTIAQVIKDQIDGPSFNEKTFAMIDAIPADKIADVMAEYREKSSFWGGAKPLFVGLYEEWNVSKDDIMKRLKEKCAQHLSTRKDMTLKPQDYKLVKKIQEGCPANQDFKQYLKEVDELFVK